MAVPRYSTSIVVLKMATCQQLLVKQPLRAHIQVPRHSTNNDRTGGGLILGQIYHIPCSHRLWVRFLVGYIISHVHTGCGFDSWSDISYPMFTQVVSSILGRIYHIPCSRRLWVRFLVGYIISHVHTGCGFDSWSDISYPMFTQVVGSIFGQIYHIPCSHRLWV